MEFCVAASEDRLRASSTILLAAVGVAALMLLGFLAGWTVFRPSAAEISHTGTTTNREPSPPPATEPEIPAEDAPVADISGLARYPGSVRTEYRREHIRDLIVTEAEYMAAGDMEPVREFYRELFQREGWSVGDLGFFQGEWVFFVIRGDHEAIVEITDLGESVEIELELSETTPRSNPPQTPARPAPQPPPAGGDGSYYYDDDHDDGFESDD